MTQNTYYSTQIVYDYIYISIYASIDSSIDGYGRAQHFKNRKMTMLQEKIMCLVVHLTHVQEK